MTPKYRPLFIYVIAFLFVSISLVSLIIPPSKIILAWLVAGGIEVVWLLLGIWGISKERGLNKVKISDCLHILISIVFGFVALSLTGLVCIGAGLVPLYQVIEVLNQSVTVPSILIGGIIAMLVVAPAEETLFRGYFFRHWRFRGFWRASLYSSLLFSGMHVLNVLDATYQSHPASFWAGATFTGLQFLYKFLVGISLCAIYEITGSLTYIIVLHGFLDTAFQVVLTPAYPSMMIVYLSFSLALAMLLRLFRMKVPQQLAS